MTVTSKEMTKIKIDILKQMHKYILEMGDEEIYEAWVMGYVPDQPQEDDYEFIATDDNFWTETCEAFGRFVKLDIKENY